MEDRNVTLLKDSKEFHVVKTTGCRGSSLIGAQGRK